MPTPRNLPVSLLACLFFCATTVAQVAPPTSGAARDTFVKPGEAPPRDHSNKHYVSNRAPLAPSPFARLPIGHITPRGWLREMLELEASGMHGQLTQISRWCKFDGNAWVTGTGQGHSAWEELPYWLKGYGDLGHVLKDEKIKAETKKWVEGILASQREDGWFAPRELLTREQGKPDLWPPMLALNVMQSWHEATGDPRVLPFMARYFKWQLTVPDADFFLGPWMPPRAGDNLESVHWLYNRTGEKWLLDLAEKIHRRGANFTDRLTGTHGVNITQGFREPAQYWVQAKDEKFLRATYRNYEEIMGRYGQMPGGMFVADENFRPGFHDPRGGAEACSMVEFMHSFQMLTRITGDAVWSDRCEDVAFNSLPAAFTPDLKALHYITCPNQVRLDPHDKTPAIQNGGTMFSYSPGAVYRCCQHNVAHGWPYYAEEMWLATSDNGLCASLYGPSEVTAKVGDQGVEVKVTEETQYPFGDTITFKVSTSAPVTFPLYLRVPQWCEQAELRFPAAAGGVTPIEGYRVLEREWKDGDTVTFRLPMDIRVRRWAANANSVSIDRGPLTYSLAIGEKWERYGGSEQWPEWQVTPTTAWNYGLVLDEKDPAKSFEVVKKRWDKVPTNPLNRYDVELKAKAKKIPNWTVDHKGAVNPLQPSPVKSDDPEETVTLIPMGAARLRIASFPVIGTGPDARQWQKPQEPPKLPVTASHVWGGDTVEALVDGREPTSSGDQGIPRFTWWDRKGGTEWVQHDFAKPRKLTTSRVYWFDDRSSGGGCRVPTSWRLLYRDGPEGEWKPVKAKGPYAVAMDRYNAVEFEPVAATALRLEAKLQDAYSGGILEWQVK